VFGQADKVILADGAMGVNPQNMGLAGTKLMYFVVEWRGTRPVPAPATATRPASSFIAAATAIRQPMRRTSRPPHAAPSLLPDDQPPNARADRDFMESASDGETNRTFMSRLQALV